MLHIVAPSCAYCDQPATLLCDYRFGWPIRYARASDGTKYPVKSLQPPYTPYTCDMPLCRAHAELRGMQLGGYDTYDFCHEHRRQQNGFTGQIAEAEADRLRQAVHALARRRLIKILF